MKVLLTKDVKGLGRAGDVKDVSDGYARNFLIAKHFALPATSSMLAKIQKEEAEHEAKISKHQQQMQDQKNKLNGKTFSLTRKAQGQKLFAGIHEGEIAQAINAQSHLSIEPKQVIIKQIIKTLGIHDAEIKFTENLHAKVKIEVKSEIKN